MVVEDSATAAVTLDTTVVSAGFKMSHVINVARDVTWAGCVAASGACVTGDHSKWELHKRTWYRSEFQECTDDEGVISSINCVGIKSTIKPCCLLE